MTDPGGSSTDGANGSGTGGEWFRYDPSARDQGRNASTGGEADLEFVRRPRRTEKPRRRRGFFGYLLVAFLAFILGLGTGYVRGYFAQGEVGAQVNVIVANGDSLSAIATKLQEAGVIEHAGAFILRVQSDGYSSQLKPGTYVLNANQPYDELIEALIEGQKPVVAKVTIPEGATLAQSAEHVARAVSGVSTEDYVRVARDNPPTFALQGYKEGSTLEGLLFPATYEVSPSIKARPFIDKQLAAFSGSMEQVDLARAQKANLTEYDVVIIASMVEREAQVAAERELVAAVIWNRLRAGMRLQIDATIQYALGKTKPVLTYDDLKVESPYNTYTHDGLPPTPIANPGLASLQAAANPAEVDYLYYVARADGTGRHYFSKTYEEFLENQAKAVRNSQ